jgi:YegS/Rv2252/BmrU family lipid kinase
VRPFVVVNPAAGGGRASRLWPRIMPALTAAVGPIDHALTAAPGDAVHFVRAALKEGPRLVIAVGGDGTASEAVDGMFAGDGAIPNGASLGYIATGTGDDFRKSLDWSGDFNSDIARIASGRSRRIDVGRVVYVGDDGPRVRHFNNIGGFGLSGTTSNAVNRATWSRLLGPKLLFKLKSLTALFSQRLQPVRVEVDDSFDETLDVALVAVANGGWFGSGMHVAPAARLDDGFIELLIACNCSTRDLIAALGQVYDGAHLDNPAIRLLRGRRLKASPLDEPRSGPVLLDIDGEAPGRLPATFEILPLALTLRG